MRCPCSWEIVLLRGCCLLLFFGRLMTFNVSFIITTGITLSNVTHGASVKEDEVYAGSRAVGGVERVLMGENEAYAVSRAVGGVERVVMEENEAYAVSRSVGGVERVVMEENAAYVVSKAAGGMNTLEASDAVEPTYEYIQQL